MGRFRRGSRTRLRGAAFITLALALAACSSSGSKSSGSTQSGSATTASLPTVSSASSAAASSATPSVPATSGAATTNNGAQVSASAQFSTPPPASLVAAAEKEGGGFTWYEGDSPQQDGPVLAAFAKAYPFVKKATEVQLLSSAVGPRIQQDAQAGGETADLASSDPATITALIAKGLVQTIPFADAGIPASLVVNNQMVETVAGVTVFLRNTKLVSDADAPKTWDDLLLPKWKGKVGTWVTPYPYAELVVPWGEEKATAYVKATQANKPVFFQTGFTESQAIAAGQIPLGVTYASTIPNSPDVAVTVPDPVPVSFLFSFVPKNAKHPATAQLFLNWLTTQEGDAIYQKYNLRGNPLLPNTATEALIKGRTIAAFPVGQSADLAKWLANFSKILK